MPPDFVAFSTSDGDGPREAALIQYGALRPGPDPEFDRIARLASRLMDAPMAEISLGGTDTPLVKASIGAAFGLTRQGRRYRDRVLRQTDIVWLADTDLEPDQDGRSTAGESDRVRFFAGVPLITPDRTRIGVLWVAGLQPRPELARAEAALLGDLAAQAMLVMELRRKDATRTREAFELALTNAILAGIARVDSFRAAMDLTVDLLLGATGAAFCHVLESREGSDLVHPIAYRGTLSSDGRVAYATFFDGRPWPRADLLVADLFDRDGATHSAVFTPDVPALPLVARALAHGFRCMTAVTLMVSGRCFVVTLSFAENRPDLASQMHLLRQVSHAIRPVLARKMFDEQLRMLSAAVAATVDSVIITQAGSLTGRGPAIVFVNDGFTRMTGHERAQTIGRRPLMLLAPHADRRVLAEAAQALEAGQPWHGELHCRRRSGALFWAECEIAPVRSEQGWVSHIMIVQRDITRRRNAALALAASEQEARATSDRLLDVMRIARLGTWRQTLGTDVVEWSDEMYRMFGVTRDGFTPRPDTISALLHPDDRDEVRTMLKAAISSGNRMEFEFRIQLPDGTQRSLWSEGQVEHDAGGRPAAVLGFCQDMTERKRAEAMLLRTQKLNALGQLTGGIAHDFNNLLTVISLNMEIVEDVLEPAHPAWEVLAPIRDAARSGAQLIQSLLAFASRSQLRPVPSDIPVLLRSVALLATRTLGERHQVEIGPSGKPLRALVDPAQFESAILNLLVNSRDAMPQGGVIRITATRVVLPADLPASAAVLAPGAYVNVAVSDAGAGIPQGLVDQVVEPFFTTKPPGSGTGLGLSMVAGFARQSGGAVTIDSVVGQGTTVHLFLPAA